MQDGTLCLDLIQDQWSPVQSVSTLLTSVQSLLTDPNCSVSPRKLACSSGIQLCRVVVSCSSACRGGRVYCRALHTQRLRCPTASSAASSGRQHVQNEIVWACKWASICVLSRVTLWAMCVLQSPANAEAARLFQSDRREYDRRVKRVAARSIEDAWG